MSAGLASLTALDLAKVGALVAGTLALMWAVRRVAIACALSAETQRKAVHVATGGAALALPLLFTSVAPVALMIAVSIAVMLALRSPALAGSGLSGVLHDVTRRSYGEIYLAIAVGILFFRAGGEPALYVLPLLIVTLADTASALIGTGYGRRRFAVEEGAKSLEGVVAFFVVTWLVAMIALLLLTEAGRLNVIVLSLVIAAFCALVEADSWQGLDNLFVPVGAHLFLARYLDSAPLELLLTAAGLAAAVAAMLASAPLLGMSRHAARAYTVLLFLVLSVTAPHNAALPIAAILAHVAARSLRPCNSCYPDLDLLVVAAGVSLLWLVAGEAHGRSAIELYNLTFAAAAVIYAGLALAGAWRSLLLVVAVAAGGLFLFVAALNPPEARWSASPWPALALGLGLPAAAALLAPGWFAARRSIKAFGLAVIVPAAVFVTEGALP